MNFNEKVNDLENAFEKLEEAIELVKSAVEGTPEENRAKSYLIPALEMALNDEHEWVGKNPCNIAKLLELFNILVIEEQNLKGRE